MSTIIITSYGLVSLTHQLTPSKMEHDHHLNPGPISLSPVFVNLPGLLDEGGAVLLPLFPQRTAGPLVARPVGECGHLHLLHVGRLLDWISFSGKEVLSQSVQDIRTENFVLVNFSVLGISPADDRNIHVNYLELVGSTDLQ